MVSGTSLRIFATGPLALICPRASAVVTFTCPSQKRCAVSASMLITTSGSISVSPNSTSVGSSSCSRTVIVESGSRCCVLHDRVRLAELRRQLVVRRQLREQLADRVVDLLGVLEVAPSSPPCPGGRILFEAGGRYGSGRTSGILPPPNADGKFGAIVHGGVRRRGPGWRGVAWPGKFGADLKFGVESG